MSDKEFIGPEALWRDSFLLAARIFYSGFRPDVLLVIWRGGTPIGIIVHEFLQYKGITTYHAALKSESYTGIEQSGEPRIEHMDSVMEFIKPDSRVLLIDDIFDTGRTIEKVCELLRARTSAVKVATLFYKERQNRTGIVPDYYVHKTDKWIVFPHELMDLSLDEVRQKDPFVHSLVTGALPPAPAR